MMFKNEHDEKKYDLYLLENRSEYLQNLYEDIVSLKNVGIFNGKNIALAGAWRMISEIQKVCNRAGITLTHLADNDKFKHGLIRCGIECQSVESLVKIENLIILVVSDRYWDEISAQLVNIGFVENQDFFVLFGGEERKRRYLDNKRGLLDYKSWEQKKNNLRLGFESYNAMCKKYLDMSLWLMHQPSLGDLYIFSMYLPVVMGVGSIAECDCVLIVVKNSAKKLAEAIGYRYIELITIEEAKTQWLPLMQLIGGNLLVHNAVPHGLNNDYITLRNYSEIDFKHSYIKFVFHMDVEMQAIYPTFPKRKNIVLSIFKENNLIPGRTVLISPYAGTYKIDISMQQWEKVVKRLQEMGYSVCTNCGNEDETPIYGTVAPYIDIQDCVEFVETAGYFIGVRSGICDLISMADCSKFVINEKGIPTSYDRFFSFEHMGIGVNVTEFYFDRVNTENMLDDILSNFSNLDSDNVGL